MTLPLHTVARAFRVVEAMLSPTKKGAKCFAE